VGFRRNKINHHVINIHHSCLAFGKTGIFAILISKNIPFELAVSKLPTRHGLDLNLKYSPDALPVKTILTILSA